MTRLTREFSFDGIEDYFPSELKDSAAELSRRLESMVNSLVNQLRNNPHVYTNDVDDPPEGANAGDVWINTGGVYRYDGTVWVAV